MFVVKRLGASNKWPTFQKRALAGHSPFIHKLSSNQPEFSRGNVCMAFKSKFNGSRFHRLCPLYQPLFNRNRPFCTALNPHVGGVSTNQIKRFFDNSRYRELMEVINMDTRIRLSVAEFTRLTDEVGFLPEDAETVRAKLSDVGLILDFGSTHNMVIIKPERMLETWEESMNMKLTHTSKFVEDKKLELEALREILKPLQTQANEIEKKADRFADLAMQGLFAYAVTYSGVLTYLIFWMLSWDIMEPVSYILGLSNLILAFYFFNTTKTEFSFKAVRDTIKLSRRNRLYKKRSFEEEEFQKILKQIEEAENDLHNPEWFILNEVSNEIYGVKLPDPVRFSQEHMHFSR